MPRLVTTIIFLLFSAVSLRAEIPASVQRLSVALGLPEVIQIMRDEGLIYGDELAETMFPGNIGVDWKLMVEEIYNISEMTDAALSELDKLLETNHIDALIDFFEGDLGAEIVRLEISARHALLDAETEEANKANVMRLIASQSPRIDHLMQFIEDNNLLESNVVGALNSNFAFLSGLADGGAYPQTSTDDQILSEIWEQEPDIRRETSEWLISFLSLAYSPLSDADLAVYFAFSKTDAGQALNIALFAGFDDMFEGISYALGRAAAEMMSREEL